MAARIELASPVTLRKAGKATLSYPVAPIVVIKNKLGKVTWLDKLKSYYHTLIAIVGIALLILNEVQPWLILTPPVKMAFSIIIGILTVLSILLKANERWIDGL